MGAKGFGLGFIGCGGYSRQLAQAAMRSEELRIAACYDPVPEAAERFSADFSTVRCGSAEELAAMDAVDGVVIVSPNNAHRPNAEAAAAAGKHVFVDKPIANTITDARAIISACRQAGVTLAVGHNGRRMPGHRKMKRMLAEGAVGKPVTVEANFSHSGGLGLTPAQWRFYRDECPGLPLMQLGIHFADTAQYLVGEVEEVCSFMSRIATPAEGEDATVSILRFVGGVPGYLGSNYASPSVYYINIYGTEGNLYCEGGAQLQYRPKTSHERHDVPIEPVDTQREELEEFARAARGEGAPEVDGQAGLKALAVVRAALASHERRQAVRIAEVLEKEL
ncbi:MAG: Gfo/Idh/MocA family oxidoreductase [Armatimonadota bacterium]